MEYEQFELFIDSFDDNQVSVKDTKVCSKCAHALPVDYFALRDRGASRRTECKKCARELNRIRKGLRDIHGQPPQGHECPICLCDATQAEGKSSNSGVWVLDHDHATDDFRGWLCHSCNRALGCFNDDVPRMQRAIKYIKGPL